MTTEPTMSPTSSRIAPPTRMLPRSTNGRIPSRCAGRTACRRAGASGSVPSLAMTTNCILNPLPSARRARRLPLEGIREEASCSFGAARRNPLADVKNLAVPAPVLVDVRDAKVRADVARLEDLYEKHGARL